MSLPLCPPRPAACPVYPYVFKLKASGDHANFWILLLLALDLETGLRLHISAMGSNPPPHPPQQIGTWTPHIHTYIHTHRGFFHSNSRTNSLPGGRGVKGSWVVGQLGGWLSPCQALFLVRASFGWQYPIEDTALREPPWSFLLALLAMSPEPFWELYLETCWYSLTSVIQQLMPAHPASPLCLSSHPNSSGCTHRDKWFTHP